MRLFLSVVLVAAVLTFGAANVIKNGRYKEITYNSFVENNITYIGMEGEMRYPNSAWGSIGTCKEGFVYIMVCDHISDAEIFEYNPKTGKMFTLGTVRQNIGLVTWSERQPKVHSQIYQHTKSGLIYFGTDAGDPSEGATYDHIDEGYRGGHLCTLDPLTKEVKDLGVPVRQGGIKSIWLDSENDAVFLNCSNGSRFVKYDIKTGKFDDLGRINGNDCPRTLFTDPWNNVYNATEASGLVRYNRSKDALEFLNTTLPGSAMGPSQVAYGPKKEYMYFINGYTVGDILKYTPEKDGPGKLDSLGILFTEPRAARNMNFANGKMYVVCTGKEVSESAKGDSLKVADLKIFDTEKRIIEKSIRMNPIINACYGGPNTDAQGNCYVAGWADTDLTKLMKEKKSRVYLIKYNPKSL